MRRLILLVFLISLAGSARAQISPQIQGAGPPTNPCYNGGQQYVDTTNKVIYNCSVPGQNWVNIGLGNTTGGSTPTLNQVLSPTSTATFSIGTTAPVTFTDPGTFASTAESDDLQSVVLGGNSSSSCNVNTVMNQGGSTFKFTNALAGVVCLPTGSTGVTNAYSNGVIGIAQVNNSGTGGQFGWVGAVGTSGACAVTVANGHCWGFNGGASDVSGNSGNFLAGNELDIQVNNTTTTGYGVFVSMRGNAQPTGDNFPAFYVQAPQGTAAATSGFECADGSMGPNTLSCVRVGQQTAGTGATNSQVIQMFAHDNSAQINDYWQLLKSDVLSSTGYPIAQIQSGNESWGIGLTSTNTLTINQLVKIDTAHADSVVVCTTSDTSCDGFIQSNEVAGQLCAAASTVCPVVTTPGSKVKGIIGTGTCAIGNFVIVDTTTNGDIKCTGSTPTITTYIGKALSACAATCAGTTIDVLTKFE